MDDKKIEEVFLSFITNCSEQDLDVIISNEISLEEKINMIKRLDSETKENILENFS